MQHGGAHGAPGGGVAVTHAQIAAGLARGHAVDHVGHVVQRETFQAPRQERVHAVATIVHQLDPGTVGVDEETLAFIQVQRQQVAALAGIDIGRFLEPVQKAQAGTALFGEQVGDGVGVDLGQGRRAGQHAGQSQGQGGDGGSAAAGQRAGGHRIAQGLGHRGHWV